MMLVEVAPRESGETDHFVCNWRHEQLSPRMLRASMGHHSWQSRTGHNVTYTAPAPMIEYVPDDTCAAPAPVVQHVALAPAVSCTSPAPATKHVSFAPDNTNIAPASPRVNRDICGLVNPQFPFFCCGRLCPASR